MILLTVRDLVRRFDRQPVLDGVSFQVRRGDRIGLVGPNGAGKTTLLRILAGLDHPDSGTIELPRGCDVVLLEQERQFEPTHTVLDVARGGLAHLYALQREAEELAERMAATHESRELERLHRQFDEVQHRLQHARAYNLQHRIDEVLHGLGFSPRDYNKPARLLSGGEQGRLLLAALLLRSPDVMLMDEPTNHLDFATAEWLEDFLRRTDATVIVVSHDRYFLDRVTGRTFELFEGELRDFPGNFSRYWTLRERQDEVQRRTYRKQQEFIARTEEFIRRNQYGQKHAQATDRKKKLDRLERVRPPRQIPVPPMRFSDPPRAGEVVFDAVGLTKSLGRKTLFRDFSFRVQRGEHVAILGPNGCGKTTLLSVLVGRMPPDAGSVKIGHNVRIGYFDQQLQSLDAKQTAVDAVLAVSPPDTTIGTARGRLALFGISGELAEQPVGSMSGGEKSRVALARLASMDVNVLVLDEPTNHLDLWARAGLERALKEYAGTVLFVTHDRYFIDQVARRVIVYHDGDWHVYDGNFSQFLAFRESVTAADRASAADGDGGQARSGKQREPTPTRAPAGRAEKPRRKRKFPYRKVADIEQDIQQTEQHLAELEAALADPQTHRDPERIKAALQEFEATRERLDRLYEHWEEAIELN